MSHKVEWLVGETSKLISVSRVDGKLKRNSVPSKYDYPQIHADSPDDPTPPDAEPSVRNAASAMSASIAARLACPRPVASASGAKAAGGRRAGDVPTPAADAGGAARRR